MKTRSKLTVAAAVLSALLASCGGGGDEAGAPQAFHITPDSIGLQWPADANGDVFCGAAYAGRVYVYGGVAPYHLDNTAPGLIETDRTKVDHPGGYFDVSTVGGCTTDAGVIVVVSDANNRQVTLKVVSAGKK